MNYTDRMNWVRWMKSKGSKDMKGT